jgi:hypothetical protein
MRLLFLCFVLLAAAYGQSCTDYIVPDTVLALEVAEENTTSNSAFGLAMAVYDDLLVVAAPGKNTTGVVALYRKTETTSFELDEEIQVTGIDSDDRFGYNLAVQGECIVVSAYEYDSAKGIVFVFRGSELIGNITESGNAMRLGASLAFTADGLMVGASSSNASGVAGGAVFYYTNDNCTFTYDSTIVSPLTTSGGEFGRALAYDQNATSGETLVIGSPSRASSTGMMFVYTNINGTWTYSANFTSPIAAVVRQYGKAVAINGDVIVVGEPLFQNSSVSGVVHVYQYDTDEYTLVQSIVADDTVGGFGHALAFDGTHLVVGINPTEAARVSGTNETSGNYSAGVIYSWNGTVFECVRGVVLESVGAPAAGYSVLVAGSLVISGAPEWNNISESYRGPGAVGVYCAFGTVDTCGVCDGSDACVTDDDTTDEDDSEVFYGKPVLTTWVFVGIFGAIFLMLSTTVVMWSIAGPRAVL